MARLNQPAETCQQNHCDELQGQSWLRQFSLRPIGRGWEDPGGGGGMVPPSSPSPLLLPSTAGTISLFLRSLFPWNGDGGQGEGRRGGVGCSSAAAGWAAGSRGAAGAMQSHTACTSISMSLRSRSGEGNIGYRFGQGWIYNWEDESSLQILALECLSWQEAWLSVKIITEWPKSKQTPTFSIYYQDEMTCLVELKYLWLSASHFPVVHKIPPLMPGFPSGLALFYVILLTRIMY